MLDFIIISIELFCLQIKYLFKVFCIFISFFPQVFLICLHGIKSDVKSSIHV